MEPRILGERLAEARRERGLTQQNAADAIDVARTTITAIEAGTRKPRASELARLLLLYGRSVFEFTHAAELLDTPPFVVQFREAGGNPAQEPHRVRAIQQFERLCHWYREMEQGEELLELPPPPPPYAWQSLTPELAGEMLASGERARLGLGDGPISDVWRLLESDAGLRIFSFPMPHTTISGMFVYSDALGACVALNANHPTERQRWTLAHEYAHFLTDRFKPEISVLGVRKRRGPIERIADAFALHFLMPTSGVIRRFQMLQHEASGKVTPTMLLQLSHLYGVSTESMTHRLEDLGLILEDTWDRLQRAGFKPGAARRHLGLPTSAGTGEPRLPLRYVALCVRAFQDGNLSEGQFAERLLSDRVGARRTIEEVASSPVMRDDGVIQQLSLDLGLDLTVRAR
jgi:Zn-dependent peptidase ImmA (M78 family)/transcriptional regulator with XRE-family HTH domain